MLFLDWLPISLAARQSLIKEGIDDCMIDHLMIRPVPERFYNELVCWRLSRDYGCLWGAAGFAQNDEGDWFFDVDERYRYSGLLCTQQNDQGYIVAIRLFRHFSDKHGFCVRTRKVLVSA